MRRGLLYLMLTDSQYMESVSAHRALALDAEDALAGNMLVIAETMDGEADTLALLEDQFPEFLRASKHLPLLDQDLLLATYALGIRQEVLGPLLGMTQTQCSSAIRAAMKRLALYLTIGKPTQATLAPILEAGGVEHVLPVPMSRVVITLARLRSCFYTEKFHDLPESCLSATIQRAIKRLAEGTTDPGWSGRMAGLAAL